MLPKTSACVKSSDDQTKWMYFLIEADNLLNRCHTIWDKVSGDTKKGFDSKPAYNKKILKTKIKSHGDEVTDFYDKEIPKEDSHLLFKQKSAGNLILEKMETIFRKCF